VWKAFACQAIGSTSNSHIARRSVTPSSRCTLFRAIEVKVNKREKKAYVLMFTCETSRAVHLKLTRTQSAEEFQKKLMAFMTEQTRPQVIISDNEVTFKETATRIQKIRKSIRMQDFFTRQEIK